MRRGRRVRTASVVPESARAEADDGGPMLGELRPGPRPVIGDLQDKNVEVVLLLGEFDVNAHAARNSKGGMA